MARNAANQRMLSMSLLQAALVIAAVLGGQDVLCQKDGSPVAKDIALGVVRVSVLGSDGKTIASQKGSSPATLLSRQQISGAQSLEVSLSPTSGGQAFKPQQVMLLLDHKASGLAAYAVGKLKKDGSYLLTTNGALIEKQIGKQAGLVDVTLLVGDPSAPAAQRYVLGSLDLPVAPVQALSALPAVRTALVQPINNIKPEIHHIFRSAQKRPPAIVSLVFTALAGVPLLGALAAILAYGVNLKGFPTDSVTALAALAFHGLLLSFMGLFLLFWLQLNLMQTIPIALVLGAALFVSGHFALSGIAMSRLKKE